MKWLLGLATAGAILLMPIAGASGQIFYRTLLLVSMTVRATPASLSVARAAVDDGRASPNRVTINSQSGAPYVLFFDQGLNATGSQRNLRGDAGIAAYQLCQDPACAKVWAPNGGPSTGILVDPGLVPTELPLTVVRAANAAYDGTSSDVLTLTMYF